MALFMEEEVKRGIALLDKKVPGWELAGRLFMESKQQCVLGKVFWHYDEGVRVLGLSSGAAASYGFTLPIERLSMARPPSFSDLVKRAGQWKDLGTTWEALAKEHMKTQPPGYNIVIDEATFMDEYLCEFV